MHVSTNLFIALLYVNDRLTHTFICSNNGANLIIKKMKIKALYIGITKIIEECFKNPQPKIKEKENRKRYGRSVHIHA